ncbi:hypothetical protein RG565_02845 [Streptococcus sp. IsoGale021]|uniref:hypothetical protein n=1 Tax=Streptococcus TaxID=1301 RepID=UPI0020010E26|nr:MULTISPECIES: hypothetical protein [Streptococcus]MCY7209427.1 hypothetical protein [Streptococcus anginosus]MCY7212596.1 hypothetical protein [Streptococcus anginosus]MCY7226148.1 hypothetical protein [Streptococcus anginosus]MDQ8694276.1 hypothetical protein [Streptococcus sp. IsoGale021]MDU5128782.1 hypothetical protein [Streptococcus anginosus]
MRLKAIRSLIHANIIYTTQSTRLSSYRKKQQKNPKKKGNVARNLVMNYLYVGILYACIFGVQGAFLPLAQNPGLFSNFVSIFYLFIFAQGFLSFYNVFYESKDLQAYRPYAFSESEIMVGKGFSVLLTTLMGVFPIVIYFIGLQMQSGQPIWLAIPILLISLGVLFSTLIFLLLVGVHFITKTTIFRKYKKLASNILLALATIMAFGAILLVNLQNNSNVKNAILQDQPAYFPPMTIFHDFSMQPFALNSLLGMGAWVVVAAILFIIVKRKVLPEFYEAAMTTTATVNRQKRTKIFKMNGLRNFPQFVLRYQLNLISDGSVLLQTLLMPSVLPYFILIPLMASFMQYREMISPYLTTRFAFPLMLIATFVASLNTGGANLTGIGISLERENYDYLKVLPFDMARYLKLKFWNLFVIQSILPFILLTIFSFVVGVQPVAIVLMIVAWTLTCLAWSAWGYHRDKRLQVTNWSNVTELFNRENNSLKMILGIVAMIIYIIIIAISAYFILVSPDLVGYLLAGTFLIALAMMAFLLTNYYLKKVQTEVEN